MTQSDKKQALEDLTKAIIEAYQAGALGTEFPLVIGLAVNDKSNDDPQLFTVVLHQGWDEASKLTGGAMPANFPKLPGGN